MFVKFSFLFVQELKWSTRKLKYFKLCKFIQKEWVHFVIMKLFTVLTLPLYSLVFFFWLNKEDYFCFCSMLWVIWFIMGFFSLENLAGKILKAYWNEKLFKKIQVSLLKGLNYEKLNQKMWENCEKIKGKSTKDWWINEEKLLENPEKNASKFFQHRKWRKIDESFFVVVVRRIFR